MAEGRMLVGKADGEYDYEILGRVDGYKGRDCILVRYLDPDYSLILADVRIIVTEAGSQLSHLAILAREYGKGVILSPGILKSARKTGKLTISGDKDVTIEMH